MKKFLTVLSIAVLPVALLCVAAVVVEWHVFRVKMRAPDAHIGILGDSLIGAGVNEKHWPEIANFAKGTTQPPVWLAKLDVILDENPQIDTFLVPMWSGLITRYPEMPSNERAQFTRGWIPLHTVLDIMRTKEMGGLPARDFARNFIRGPLWSFLNRCAGREIKRQMYRQYEERNCVVTDSDEWKNGCKMEINSWGSVPASNDLLVFKEYNDIFNMLKVRGKAIIIVTPPLMPIVQEQITANGVREWSAARIKEYVDKYQVPYFDFTDSVPEPECYEDSVHLNSVGARKFTTILKDRYYKEIAGLHGDKE